MPRKKVSHTPAPDQPELTIKQTNFLRHYLANGNASAAYRACYDGSNMSDDAIRNEAWRLLQHPEISRRIKEHGEKMKTETQLSLEDHMTELRTLREMAKQNAQMSAAIKAEELRGKLRRFYVEQIESGGPREFDRMSDEELRQHLIEEAKALGLVPPAPRANTRGNGTQH